MGKNRDKQRTKGNLKPSSSGRAAALVTRDGALGFVGFDGQGSSNLGYVPMTTSPGDEVDNTVDGSFRMVMRKLSKRDSLTKYKALQEFSELCKSSKSEVVEGVLPFWPRLYNKLSMDVDQRVREATQEAMFQLVQRVGRNLAPYLKSLIGAWLCAQFDSYAPVASSAQRAFLAAFSETKQIEALMFCKVGLCEFLEDSILRQTAETLSDPKIVSKEEREAKYNRVVSSSLLALGYLMTASSNEVNIEMQSRYQEIFEEKKLWKLARHSSPLVRSAVFSLVISSCMKIPTVIQSVCSQVCPVILSSLDESEPAVCQNLWGAVLFVLKTIPDCWLHVNVRKAVLPKLWSVLTNGGYGCASVIYPSLLPFISTLPQEVVSSGVGFYQNFFDNLQEGLQKPRVQHSSSECAVVMATYIECLRYCLVHSSLQENGWSIKGYLIKDQLLPLMRNSLQHDTLVPTMHLYLGVSDLLNFLNKNLTMETARPKKAGDVSMAASSHDVTRDTITMRCKQEALSGTELVVEEAEIILDWFWQGFNSICMDILTEDGDRKLNTRTIESLASCIFGLISSSAIPKKQKKQKVAFANPKDETLPRKTEIQPLGQTSSYVKIEDLYGGQLLDIACNVCHLCMKKLQCKSTLHLKLFSSLFPHFISDKLLQVLLEKNSENEQKFVELCDELLSSVVYPWLADYSDETKELPCVMDVLFGVLKCYTLESQIDTLNKVLETNNSTDFMYTLLQKGIELSISGISTWLASQSGSEKVQKLLRVARCDDSDLNEESFWGIIKLCIADQKTGPLVSMSSLDIIMENIVEMLRSKNDKHLSRILGVLHGYFEWCRKNPDDLSCYCEDILLSLFLIQLSKPSLCEQVLETWQTGLQAVSIQTSKCNVLLIRTSAIINEQHKSAQSVDSVLSLSGSAVQLLKAASNLSTEDSFSTLYVHKIYHSLLPDPTQCTEWREKSNKGSWLGSHLCSSMPILSQIPETQIVADILDTHQKVVTLVVLVTKTVLAGNEGLTAITVSDDVLVRLYLEAAWIHVWCLCILGCRNINNSQKSSTFIQQLPKIHSLSQLISRTLLELQSVLEERQILALLFQESLMVAKTKGWLWTVVFTDIIQQLIHRNVDLDLSAVLTELNGTVFDNATSSFRSDENREAIIQSISCLLPYVGSIYDVKVITEHGNKYFEQELSTEEYSCVFPLVSESLSTWSKLTNTSEEAKMEYQLTLIETLDGLMEWKNKHDRILLLNATLNDVTAAELTINIAILNIIKLAVQDAPNMLTSSHWDFILCGIAGWLQTCEENFPSISTSIVTNNLCQQTFKVLTVVSKHFQDLPEQPQKEPAQEQSHNMENDESSQHGAASTLIGEWQEFFSINLYNCVISMFLKAAEMSSKNNSLLPFVSTCESLGLAMTYLPISVLENYEFTHTTAGDGALPQWAQDVLHYTLPLISSSVYPLQIAAYLLLARVMPVLASCHTHKENHDEENEIQRSPPVQLMQDIDSALSHMVSILDGASVPFGTRLCLASDHESLTDSFTLFMSCRLLIIFFQQTNVQTRPEYALFLRKNKFIDKLMSVLFRIIPLDGPTAVTEGFELSVKDDVTENLAQKLGRSLYYSVLRWMPAMVRQWFNRLEKKYANVVDKYTSSSVTPSLYQREMTQVKNSSLQFSNMQVKARPVAGEVAAVYTVDDLSMELVVKLPNNHPLGVVTVDSGKKVGVTTSQWRSWILQLTTFLTHQNGSIMDGLVLWKQNADKHFEGVEDCMICFSVIHASNYSLPKLSCRTCKKKFHNICLYRWFNTSNNSTCPLCRNIF